MVSVKGMLFIDANLYLELYRTVTGKKLLAGLEEQRDHIFVTAQVVDEVQRRKVEVAASFLAEQCKKLTLDSVAVPDYLSSTTDDRTRRMREQIQEIRNKIKETKEEWKQLAHDLLGQISRSEDEISKALAGIFAQAISPNEGELQRAKARKERGNPPGKKADPLGDQLSWEQILSYCQDKRRLWVITRDGDYVTEHEGKVFLNAALYQELARLYQSAPEVFCFNNIPDGLRHFANTTQVKAEKLPTLEETEQIKKEQESLPPLGWLDTSYFNDAASIAVRNAYRRRASAALIAALSNPITTMGVFPPPEANEAEEDRA
jgi:hypothetical protein